MRKLSSPMRYQAFALVEATSVLGILDNMRYDRACPWEERDAHILEQGFLGLGDVKSVKFVLTKWVEFANKKPCWTMDRWGSDVTLTPISSEEAYRVERGIERH